MKYRILFLVLAILAVIAGFLFGTFEQESGVAGAQALYTVTPTHPFFNETVTPVWGTYTPAPIPPGACKYGYCPTPQPTPTATATATQTPPPDVVQPAPQPTATPTLFPQCDGPTSFCGTPPIRYTLYLPFNLR